MGGLNEGSLRTEVVVIEHATVEVGLECGKEGVIKRREQVYRRSKKLMEPAPSASFEVVRQLDQAAITKVASKEYASKKSMRKARFKPLLNEFIADGGQVPEQIGVHSLLGFELRLPVGGIILTGSKLDVKPC